ncbi:hypothetical protein QRD38_07795 [Leptospira weilii]|uniref:hypothetical protein n=1 Tax=Leptospira weilii TaxID=28184 RepID=UPI00055D429F|nr:hypothetical protein [Leptospira weilii]MDL5245699.1 hypothetical protein [Leptospira weilii]QDK28482.1 hypothetical protein FHG68_18840 [Leptospira weilii]ULH28888.1 hypothetical protein FH586_02750 [Leptospira weilii]
MKKRIGILLVSSIGLTGCANYKEIKNEDLNVAFIVNSSPTFKGYYYRGSDNNFDYFVSKWDFERDRHFKIAVGKLHIVDSLKFRKDERELRFVLFKTDTEFAKGEFYTLYVMDVDLQ